MIVNNQKDGLQSNEATVEVKIVENSYLICNEVAIIIDLSNNEFLLTFQAKRANSLWYHLLLCHV